MSDTSTGRWRRRDHLPPDEADAPILLGMAAGKYLFLAKEGALPVTHLFDAEGEEVERLDRACNFIAGPKWDGRWAHGRVALAQIVPVN